MESRLPYAGRFRPASNSDFLRYAKNVAWLTSLPLQQAQEQLARLYGYSGRHELQQALAQGGEPGPFSEPPCWPAFDSGLTPSAPTGGNNRVARGSPLYLARQIRTWRWTDEIADHDLARRGLVGCWDAGLFCDPVTHKHAFKAVQEGCQALDAEAPESWQQYLCSHWPVGFWALLERTYSCRLQLTGPRPRHVVYFEPAAMFRAVRDYRAPHVFLQMLGQARKPSRKHLHPDLAIGQYLVTKPGDIEAFLRDKDDAERWEYAVRDWFRSFGTPERLIARQAGRPAKPAEIEAVYEAAATPQAVEENQVFLGKLIASPELFDSLLFMARNWRLSEIVGRCNLGLEHGHRQELLMSGCAMPGGAEHIELERRFFVMNNDPRSKKEEVVALGRQVMATLGEGRLGCYLHLQQVRNSYVVEPEGVTVWRYCATFTQETDLGASASPIQAAVDEVAAKVVGGMSGFLLVPFDNKYSTNAETWFTTLTEGDDDELTDVWKVLQHEYFPSVGLAGIEAFVEENPGQCIATATVELSPEYRGRGLVPYLFRVFTQALDENPSNAVDNGWARQATALAPGEYEVFDIDDDPWASGTPVFGTPAILVLPIAGSEPVVERFALFPDLVSARKLRKANPQSTGERLKRKLTAHFLAMQERVEPRIVMYDPLEWPQT